MRNPRYRHEAPTTERDVQLPEGGDPNRQLSPLGAPSKQSAPNLAPIIWGAFDTRIHWGGTPGGDVDGLSSSLIRGATARINW